MSNPIFDHINTRSDLPPANQGITQYQYRKIRPDRGGLKFDSSNYATDTFSNAEIDFAWTVAANKHWVPARSYFRTRVIIDTDGANTMVAQGAQIAPALNLAGNFYTSASFKISDTEVSKIKSNFTQIDTLETRMTKSKGWLDTVGQLNFWDPSFTRRVNVISSDGLIDGFEDTISQTKAEVGIDAAATMQLVAANNTGLLVGLVAGTTAIDFFTIGDVITHIAVTGLVVVAISNATTIVFADVAADVVANANFTWTSRVGGRKPSRRIAGCEIIWNPPFSAFKISKALPGGDYRISLTPEPAATLITKVVERPINSTAGYHFRIIDMNYFVATMIGPRRDTYTYVLDLDETECHARTITQQSGDIQTTVSSATYGITVALQDSRAGRQTNLPASKFIVGDGSHLNLERIQIDYADQTKPDPQADLEYNKDGLSKDFYGQRYADSMLYSGRYFSAGGCELQEDWEKTLGPYYYFPFPKDASDKSTTVSITYGLSAVPAYCKMLVFEHRKNHAVVEISGSTTTVKIAKG